jgi:GT2 family glycosyltransferase
MPGAALDPAEVTVAIATMGRPAALARCLAAIARGTVLPGEVVVVDQAPSAASRSVVAEATLLRVTHLERRPRGVSAARNAALDAAAGRVIAYTDDDCQPDPTWLEAIAAAFARPPAPAAVTGRVLPLGPRPPGGVAVSLRSSTVGADYRGRTLPSRPGTGGNLAIEAATLRTIGGWDARFGPGAPGRAAEDVELLYRLTAAGCRVRYEPGAVVRHDWQQPGQRLRSRWSYGYGYGALCGMLVRGGDRFGLRALAIQARYYLRELVTRARQGDRSAIDEHVRSLAGLAAGWLRGLTLPR